jgi:GMP synthase-like glutamine amidotransferase
MADITFIQHTKDTTPGYFWDLAKDADLDRTVIKAWRDPMPKVIEGEYLVILGGEEPAQKMRWFKDEMTLIMNELHGRETPIFGICLGAEMVSLALGEQLKKMKREEYGWCDVWVNVEKKAIDGESYVWQWHEEYFDQPPGTKLLVTSEKIKCQAYEGPNFVCTQFHPEITADTVEAIQDHKVSVYDYAENDYMLDESQSLASLLFELFLEKGYDTY